MLNENKVKVMTKMAMYESKQGVEDIKINSYYRRDYVSYKTLISLIWMTIGYVLIVGLGAGIFLDNILERLTINFAVLCIVSVLGMYLALALLYTIGASQFYKIKYTKARARLKKYNHNLTKIIKMYEKEKR